MRGARADTLLQLMLFMELFTIRPALSDLTDDEYFWEPSPSCWSVRRSSEVRTADHLGDGDWVAEYDRSIAEAPAGSAVHPLTTIAWNLAHVAPIPDRVCDLDVFGGPVVAGSEPVLGAAPSSASEAVAMLESGWRRLDSMLQSCPDEVLEQSWTWPFGETTGFQHVALMLNELSHHGAQVCELRDLRRAWVPRSPA